MRLRPGEAAALPGRRHPALGPALPTGPGGRPPLPSGFPHVLRENTCTLPPRGDMPSGDASGSATARAHRTRADAQYLRLVGGGVVRDGHELLGAQALRQWLLLTARHGLLSRLRKAGRAGVTAGALPTPSSL